MSGRVVSSRFPYLPLTLTVHGRTATIEALLDTGFDGDVAVPLVLVGEEVAADTHLRWILADGSQAWAPAYLGTARLGNFGPFPILLTAIGNEPIVGRGLTDRFLVILDYGQRVIVEP